MRLTVNVIIRKKYSLQHIGLLLDQGMPNFLILKVMPVYSQKMHMETVNIAS